MWELCSVISNDSALTLSFGIIVYHPLVRLSHPMVWSGSCLGIRRTGQLVGTLFESSHLNQGISTGRPVFRTHRGKGVVTPALAQPISWRQCVFFTHRPPGNGESTLQLHFGCGRATPPVSHSHNWPSGRMQIFLFKIGQKSYFLPIKTPKLILTIEWYYRSMYCRSNAMIFFKMANLKAISSSATLTAIFFWAGWWRLI